MQYNPFNIIHSKKIGFPLNIEFEICQINSNLFFIYEFDSFYIYNFKNNQLKKIDNSKFTKNEKLLLLPISNCEIFIINKTSGTKYIGETENLTVIYNPSNTTDSKAVTWTTSNSKVATVSGGTVKAVGAGTATITATTADGNYTATCKVTVNEENNASEQKTLEEIEVKLEKNKDFSFIGYVGHKLNKKGLVVTVTYSDGTTKDITTGYTISPDEKFAKADDGKMKVLKVSYTENGVTKTCEINVKVIEDSTIKDDDDLPDTGAIVVASIITIACLATAIGYLGYKKYKQI